MVRLISILMMMAFAFVGQAQVSVHAPQSDVPDMAQDSLTVSLITKYPAAEVYQLYGHEAIRVKSATYDLAFDYGLFDFTAPNFIYRFVKGETDYMAGCHDFEMFMLSCARDGAMVVEQTLNLTDEEKHRLVESLMWDVQPQNRTYRYNYVKNNCATKVLDKLDAAVGQPIAYDDSVRYGTYRKQLTHYGRNYAWYQFGIDMLLGSGLDYDLERREEMFVPVELMHSVEQVRLADGRRLVQKTEVIYEGRGDMTLPATPTIQSPLMVMWALMVVVSVLTMVGLRRGKIFKGLYMFWYGLCGVVGCLVLFMVLASEHEATSPNINVWWLNPSGLVVAALVCCRKVRRPLWWFMALKALSVIALIVVLPFQAQVINTANYPLILIDLILSVAYLVNGENKDILQSALAAFKRK